MKQCSTVRTAGIAAPFVVGLLRHRRVSLVVGGLIALIVLVVLAGAGSVLLGVSHAETLDDGLADEQSLIAHGLSGTPAAEQPNAPVAVDRVLVDGANTWVQYHVATDDMQQLFVQLDLFDDQGNSYSGPNSGECQLAGSTWFLPRWFPWQPGRRVICYEQLPSLRATARAAVLRMQVQVVTRSIYRPLGYPPLAETVRVPLDLHFLRQRHTIRLHLTATTHGTRLTLSQVTNWPLGGRLAFTIPGQDAFAQNAILTAASGQSVPVTGLGAYCGVTTCTEAGTFASLPRGTHVTLTISGVQPDASHPSVPGPWRFSFVMP